MKNQKIEAGLSRAIERIAPDIYEKVATKPIRKNTDFELVKKQLVKRGYSTQQINELLRCRY